MNKRRVDEIAIELAKFYHKFQKRKDGKTPYFEGHLEPVMNSIDENDWSLWSEIKHANFRYVGVDVDDWHGSVYPFLRAVAVLHDSVEDILCHLGLKALDTLKQDLMTRGINENLAASVVDAVALLSKNIHHIKHENDSYLDYLSKLVENPFTREVKMKDISHNISDLTKGNMRDKYELALNYLKRTYSY
jgi:hypothetical protein